MTDLEPLRWTDLGPLADLEQRIFPDDAWTEQMWWAELAQRPRRAYVVAREGEAILGYAGVDLAGDTADVMTVAVAPGCRGRGVGDLLLSEIIRRAAESGAAALLLEVRADNEPALALYARHGFEQISMRRRYYQPGDVDALVLRLLLGADHG